MRALFAVAKTEADVSLAVARAFKLANTPPHQARLSPGGQPTSRAASFGEARHVSVTVDGGYNSFRHLDLPLSAGCVELYRAAAAAFAVSPRSFQLLRRRSGTWRRVVDDADLREAMECAMQLQPPQLSLRKQPCGEPAR